MTKRAMTAALLISRYNRSTGNFADNLREMDAQDIDSQYQLRGGMLAAQRVYDHIHRDDPLGCPTGGKDD